MGLGKLQLEYTEFEVNNLQGCSHEGKMNSPRDIPRTVAFVGSRRRMCRKWRDWFLVRKERKKEILYKEGNLDDIRSYVGYTVLL
jgi:hypothetical protein